METRCTADFKYTEARTLPDDARILFNGTVEVLFGYPLPRFIPDPAGLDSELVSRRGEELLP